MRQGERSEPVGNHLESYVLFVVDDSGVLIGVISALDVLRHLCQRKWRAA